MKKLSILLIACFLVCSGYTQVNVRVKNSPGSREFEVKTGGKPAGSSKEQEPKTSPATEPGKPAGDTNVQTGGSSFNETYKGPAKVHVKAFWDIVQKLKDGKGGSADNLEKQLKNVKEKDPSYNTGTMESEFAVWKAKATEAKQNEQKAEEDAANKIKAGRDEKMAKTKNESLLQEVIDGTVMQVGHNNLPFVDKAMTDYKAKVDEVLQLDLSKYKVKLDDLKRYVDKSHTLAADRIIATAKTIIGEVKDAENFTPAYKELQFRQLYWESMKKIYTGDATCEKYYKAISDMLAKTGSPDDIKKTASKNAAEAIKNRKMAAPVVKDAALEKILINGFNSKYKSKYNGTAIKAVLLQDGWTIERNDLTGIVTGRNRVCELAYKGADGKCYLLPNPIYIYQAYVGNAFTNTEVIYNGFSGDEMLCENIK